MFPQRSKLLLMNSLKQVIFLLQFNVSVTSILLCYFKQPLKEVSHGDEVLEEDDDDEIEALDNEGVGDEVEDGDEVSVFCL